jgi:hypothetical protein
MEDEQAREPRRDPTLNVVRERQQSKLLLINDLLPLGWGLSFHCRRLEKALMPGVSGAPARCSQSKTTQFGASAARGGWAAWLARGEFPHRQVPAPRVGLPQIVLQPVNKPPDRPIGLGCCCELPKLQEPNTL